MRKNAREILTITCHKCQKPFEKEAKEVRRQNKRGQINFYCSLCSTRPDFKSNKFTPFRKFFLAARRRYIKKGFPVDITVEYLAEIWNKQGGRCPYTGYAMELGEIYWKKLNSPTQASLDRIDSSKGYIKGNVEFVCLSVNYAKASFSREKMLDFFKAEYSTIETV